MAAVYMSWSERISIAMQALSLAVHFQLRHGDDPDQVSKETPTTTTTARAAGFMRTLTGRSNHPRRYTQAFGCAPTIGHLHRIVLLFQTELKLWGRPYAVHEANRRPDADLLEWLYDRLAMRLQSADDLDPRHLDRLTIQDTRSHDEDSTEVASVEVAAMIYAVMVGSLDMPDTQAGDTLEPLRLGVAGVVDDWEKEIDSGGLHEETMQHIALMMVWLETESGLAALAHLIGSRSYGALGVLGSDEEV
jgi:hypothetical protein